MTTRKGHPPPPLLLNRQPLRPLARMGTCLLLAMAVCGCTGRYFRNGGPPPAEPTAYSLEAWPYESYWTGIVFNGEKIGFSHLKISLTEPASDGVEIHAEAVFRIRFLSVDKNVVLRSVDRVGPGLELRRFAYDYDMDGNRMKLTGEVADGRLAVTVETRGQSTRQEIPLAGTLFPASAMALYPALHGLAVGRQYAYTVYDGETRTLSPVTQKVVAYEASDLFPGKAFRVLTRFQGRSVTTWMDTAGRPVLEISMGGVLIAALETEAAARRYLATAAFNKDETLLSYSRIRTDRPIDHPENLRYLELELAGTPDRFLPPADDRQTCRDGGGGIICVVQADHAGDRNGAGTDGSDIAPHLASTYRIPADHPEIRRIALTLADASPDTPGRVQKILGWMQEHIRQEAVDAFTALDVLETRRAECQGHTLLYAALARSMGIPTRVANGIVYASAYGGFLYHTWAESRIDGRWMAVDPTFGQMPADATHVRLIRGEEPSALLPLLEMIGKLKARVIRTEP